MNKDNVVQFPFGEIRNPIVDPGTPSEMDIASECLEAMLVVLLDSGYNIKGNPKLQQDLGLVLNILYAIISRVHEKPHFMHDTLDEISLVLNELKEELENDNH